ncbi:MAG: hypothetical protein C4336_05710, partial [Armatimonadota bacterium]
RPAVRLLKSAGVLPDWMERAREIERLREECIQLWLIAECEYHRMKATEPQQFEHWHAETWNRLAQKMQRVNSLILAHNCTAPSTAMPLLPDAIDKEYARFCERFPYAP